MYILKSSNTCSEIIDPITLKQLLDLDDDGERRFSKAIVYSYFSIASTAIRDFETAIPHKDLVRLSYLADTLKTGSLSVGAIRVAASSEKLVHYGNCIDTDVSEPLTEPAALRKIEAGFVQVKKDYGEAEMWLKKYFEGSQDAERESSSETITKSSVTPIIL